MTRYNEKPAKGGARSARGAEAVGPEQGRSGV